MKFQSTRPRGARPYEYTLPKAIKISIHAPTRGATRGAVDGRSPRHFNPRAHEGRDAVGAAGA